MQRRKIISLSLVGLLAIFGLFLLGRNIYQANVGDVYNVSGVIYGEDTKIPLDKVQIMSTNADAPDELNTYETTDDGWFSIFLPLDLPTNQISIYKEGYWDIEATIINSQRITDNTLNIVLKPGFGKEEAQIVPIKKSGFTGIGGGTDFGLFVEPFDDSPGSVPTSGIFSGYDLTQNTGIIYNVASFEAKEKEKFPSKIQNASASYDSLHDKYYLLGGVKEDESSSTDIYEYDRNDPNNTKIVAQLPFGGAGSASIYLPEKDLIVIFLAQIFEHPTVSRGVAYGFNPTTKNVYGLGPIPKGTRQQIVRAENDLYLITDLEDQRTVFTKIKISDINVSDSCLMGKGSCGLAYRADVITRDTLIVGSSAYYSNSKRKIYLLGGINKDLNLQKTIYEIDPFAASKPIKPTLSAKTLSSPLANAKIHQSNQGRIFLYGGYLTNNTAQGNKVLYLDSNLDASETEMAFPQTANGVVNAFATVQDNSDRSIIFSYPNVLSFAPKLTFKAGQVYGLSAYEDQTLVFRGRNKKDDLSFDFQRFDDGKYQYQKYPQVKLANPYTQDITLADITFTKDDKTSDLSQANGNGWISVDGGGGQALQPRIDLQNLSQALKPGQFISFYRKKNGVRVGIKKEVTAENQGGNITVEVPEEVSYEDVLKIAEHRTDLSATEQEQLFIKKRQTYIKIAQAISYSPSLEENFDKVIYLSKNGKPIITGSPNPYYFDRLSQTSQSSIKKTLAADDKAEITFKVDRASFGGDIELYSTIQNFISQNSNKFKEILGEPIFTRDVVIADLNIDYLCQESPLDPYMDPAECQKELKDYLEDGGFLESFNEIVLDTTNPLIKQGLEHVLLHEIGHSWTSVIGSSLSFPIEEGIAQGFSYVFAKRHHIVSGVPYEFDEPVTNFDYWTKTLDNYALRTQYALALSPDPINNIEIFWYDYIFSGATDEYGFFPQDNYFWTRRIWGSAFMKLYYNRCEEPTLEYTYFPQFFNSLFNKAAKDAQEKGIIVDRSNNFRRLYEEIFDFDWSYGDSMEIFQEASKTQTCDSIEDTTMSGADNWLIKRPALFYLPKLSVPIEPFIVIQYPAKLPDPSGTAAYYINHNFIILNLPEVKKNEDGENEYKINALQNADVNVFAYYKQNNQNKKITLSPQYSDKSGLVFIDDIVNALQQQKYTGSFRLIVIAKYNNKSYVFAKNLFMKNGELTGNGLYGTVDLPEDKNSLRLGKVILDDEVSTTNTENGIYEFPSSFDYGDESSIRTIPDNKEIVSSIIKWPGNYQHDIKTDTENPIIASKDPTDKINLNLNEPSSVFVEYGAEKDKYDQISFGKVTSGEIREGDEVKDGDRSLTVEEFEAGKTYHYRLWAIDASGNVSHTDDLTFTKREIKNIQVSDITATSAKISWETTSDATGQVEYGKTADYGSTSDPTAQGTTHSITLSGLTANNTYHFRIKAHFEGDAADQFVYSDDQTFNTSLVCGEPTVIVKPDYSGFTVTADESHPYIKAILYNGQRYGEYSGDLHKFTINSPVPPPHKYSYQIEECPGVNHYFTVYTYINDVQVCNSPYSATITWTTAHGSPPTELYYRKYFPPYGDYIKGGENGSATLTNLDPNTEYTFGIESQDGLIGNSYWDWFRTLVGIIVTPQSIKGGDYFDTNVPVIASGLFSYECIPGVPVITSGTHLGPFCNNKAEQTITLQDQNNPANQRSATTYMYNSRIYVYFNTPQDPYCHTLFHIGTTGSTESVVVSAITQNTQTATIEFQVEPSLQEQDDKTAKDVVKAEIEFGTSKSNLDQKTSAEAKDNKFTAQLPVKSARTYSYQIVRIDKDGQKQYSEVKTLKYGHWFPRFFNDIFGNFWGWVKSKF